MAQHNCTRQSMSQQGVAAAVQALRCNQVEVWYAVGLAASVWWHRELQERLRSLVGGAITRMTRERASKDHIADLERQLQACKVFLQPSLASHRKVHSCHCKFRLGVSVLLLILMFVWVCFCSTAKQITFSEQYQSAGPVCDPALPFDYQQRRESCKCPFMHCCLMHAFSTGELQVACMGML